MEIFNHDSNINFLGMRNYSIAVAILLVIASVALIGVRGLNYGLDFTGGVSLVVDYEQPVQVADVRAALAKGGMDHAIVQALGGTREVAMRCALRTLRSIAGSCPASSSRVSGDFGASAAAKRMTRGELGGGDELCADGVTGAR